MEKNIITPARRRTEAKHQEALFEWAKMREAIYPELKWMFHIPNGGSRNAAEASGLKRQGVKAGVSDIFLPCPRGLWHGLWIEMKAPKGKPSEKQIEFIEDMRRHGYAAYFCYGWQDAADRIVSYMEASECAR